MPPGDQKGSQASPARPGPGRHPCPRSSRKGAPQGWGSSLWGSGQVWTGPGQSQALPGDQGNRPGEGLGLAWAGQRTGGLRGEERNPPRPQVGPAGLQGRAGRPGSPEVEGDHPSARGWRDPAPSPQRQQPVRGVGKASRVPALTRADLLHTAGRHPRKLTLREAHGWP